MTLTLANSASMYRPSASNSGEPNPQRTDRGFFTAYSAVPE